MTFTIGNLQCPRGGKVRGVLNVAPTYGADVAMPIGIVHGAEDGPSVAVVAGVHGSEYAGIEAASRLFASLDPTRTAGSVVVVPVANVAAFRAGTALVNPIDGLNLNRVFPGDGGRSVSHLIARTLLLDVAIRCDMLIDLHGGDLGEAMVPTVSMLTSDDASGDEAARALAAAFGTEYVRRRPATTARGTFTGEVRARGIPAIMCEIGTGGAFEEGEISLHVAGVTNVLRHLQVVEGAVQPIETFEAQSVSDEEELVAVDRGGVFQPRVGVRDRVRAGDLVAEITDVWGDVLETRHAANDGVVRLMFMRRVVQPGNALMVLMSFA